MSRLSQSLVGWVLFAALLTCALGLCEQGACAQESRRARAALKKLDTVLPEFRFEELPFEVAIEFLSDITRVKIIVEWREVGFERDHPVSLWLRNAPLRTALRIILAEVSDPKKPCDFDVRGATIVISSARKLAGPLSMREYELAPLLKRFEERGFRVRPEEIAAVILGATNRGQWAAEGGPGSLVVKERKLEIDQTRRGHGEIEKLLAQLDKPNPDERAEAKLNRQVLALLEQVLPEVRFQESTFDQVLEWLRDITSLNIAVDWKRLDAVGVDRDTPVSVRLGGATMREALDGLLAELGGKKQRLDYDITGGVVWISTAEEIAPGFAVRVYDVSDVLEKAKSQDAQLLGHVRQHALKKSWRSRGGAGELWLVGDRLVVVQSCRGHQAVEGALDEYRAKTRRGSALPGDQGRA